MLCGDAGRYQCRPRPSTSCTFPASSGRTAPTNIAEREFPTRTPVTAGGSRNDPAASEALGNAAGPASAKISAVAYGFESSVAVGTRLGVMFNPDSPTAAGDLTQAEQAAKGLNLIVRSLPARRADEIEPAIAALARDSVDCMYIQAAPPVPAFVREIGSLLLKHRIPAISELRDLARNGAVLSYGPNVFESTRRQAYFVNRILKGTRPADLPVEQATKLELVINLKTAKAVGLEVPPTLLAIADEVIE
jgi:hypothetical protein